GRGSPGLSHPGQRRRARLEGGKGRDRDPAGQVGAVGRQGGSARCGPVAARRARPMRKITREEALEYHSRGRNGKIEVRPSKPTRTAEDLSLAYSPGVAEPCLEIQRDPEKVYDYTAKGNLVGVISNGTAVLGLGNIGPLAAKPVMEGKGILFKRFADIDGFEIQGDAPGPRRFHERLGGID